MSNFVFHITEVDRILDDRVHMSYKGACSLAQDWARVAKITEEAGEAIAELIAWTGQNPRKGLPNPAAHDAMLRELADTALTAIYAMQHFIKDAPTTVMMLEERAMVHYERLKS